MATHFTAPAGRLRAAVAGVLGLLLLGACTDREPAGPSTAPVLNTTDTRPRHAVEAKVQSAQCPVDGTTVTWVNIDTQERFFMQLVRNIATGEVPEGRYIMHWRPILYSTVIADPDALSRAPFRDEVTTQSTPLATNPFCVASIYTVTSNGNNSNRIPLTLDNYLLALDQYVINVTGYTKLLPMSLGAPGALIRGQVRDEKGNPTGLDQPRNVFRIEPWPDGVGPFGCAAGNEGTGGRCRLLQGILESFGTVGTSGQFEFGANPDTEGKEWVLEMKSVGKNKVYFKPFRVSGGQTVDLDVFEEDRRAFLYYITEDRGDQAAGGPDLLAGTAGWTLVRGKVSDNIQIAHSWAAAGAGFYRLNLTSDPGTSKAKSYTVEARCDGSASGSNPAPCTLVSAPRGVKVGIGGGGRLGEGTVIFTLTLSGVNEVCSFITAGSSSGFTTPTDWAPSAAQQSPATGCQRMSKSDGGDGNTWIVPF